MIHAKHGLYFPNGTFLEREHPAYDTVKIYIDYAFEMKKHFDATAEAAKTITSGYEKLKTRLDGILSDYPERPDDEKAS